MLSFVILRFSYSAATVVSAAFDAVTSVLSEVRPSRRPVVLLLSVTLPSAVRSSPMPLIAELRSSIIDEPSSFMEVILSVVLFAVVVVFFVVLLSVPPPP